MGHGRTFLQGFTLFISSFFLLSSSLAFSAGNDFDTSNTSLMNATIIGAIASIGFACYQGKSPCTLAPNVNLDKLTVSIDKGSDNTVQHLRIALGADWQEAIYESKHFLVDGRWEINSNFWQSTQKNPTNKNGWIIGLTPVFQYSPKDTWANGVVNPYFELGGGPQFLSDSYIENENKSTQFQFGSILGFGVSNKLFEIGYRYLHISNANIELPNPGTDFHNIHVGIKF